MYIAVKQRENEHSERVFYLYLCQSKRVEGKVTNRQKYLISVREQNFMNGTYKEKFNDKMASLANDVKEKLQRKITENC